MTGIQEFVKNTLRSGHQLSKDPQGTGYATVNMHLAVPRPISVNGLIWGPAGSS